MTGWQRASPAAWPVALKVPLLVAALMVAISTVLTNQVLQRLAETQRHHLDELAAAHLDGLSSSIMPAVLREDAWEVFDTLDRGRALYQSLNVVETVVVTADGMVLAASNPKAVPAFKPAPLSMIDRFATEDAWLDPLSERAGARRLLVYQSRTIGAIYAEFDMARQFAERRHVLWTLVGTNAAITLFLAIAGFALIRGLLRPVRILTRHLRAGATGPVPGAELPRPRSEFGQLFRQYNDMVRAWNEREALAARIAEEERLASLGRLASGMAHEINNPLGGLFNAIDTLKRHGHDAEVRQRTVSLVERGLSGIRDVVRAMLADYRADAANRPLKPADIDDLRLLIEPELVRRDLDLDWRNELVEDVPVPAGAIRQAVLNLLLNACHASPEKGRIGLEATHTGTGLVIAVADDGPGLDPARARYLQEPTLAAAPRPGERGLGLWIVRRLVLAAGGKLSVERPASGGTLIRITVPTLTPEALSHAA
ncbi:sensor histidine kinase [Blastochloris tepida]|uniref:histidine kinase n=1 Tax=Blastochloris tepida TaxID=2233851 RepID=A0A348FYF6_9HYPH|nr:HAMP domain-containing sensor histidine kinase [Blastochloris tepida]BBF92339.1 hypothetical protein BLTE_10240 [Blastochloris tepida]